VDPKKKQIVGIAVVVAALAGAGYVAFGGGGDQGTKTRGSDGPIAKKVRKDTDIIRKGSGPIRKVKRADGPVKKDRIVKRSSRPSSPTKIIRKSRTRRGGTKTKEKEAKPAL